MSLIELFAHISWLRHTSVHSTQHTRTYPRDTASIERYHITPRARVQHSTTLTPPL